MTQYKITAPVVDFRGEVAGVVFSQGQALLSVNPDAELAEGATALAKPRAALAYFKRKGYAIEEIAPPKGDEAPSEQDEVDDGPKPPGKSAPKADWVTYAKSVAQNSDEEAAIDAMSKEDLVAKYSKEASK